MWTHLHALLVYVPFNFQQVLEAMSPKATNLTWHIG